MNNTPEKKRKVPFLNIGSSSLLVVFLVLCLIIFAVLTLASAQSDYRFARKLADRRTAYYAACNEAEEAIAALDADGTLVSLSEPYTFQIPIDDRQALCVELSPDGTNGYRISQWQIQNTEEWVHNP